MSILWQITSVSKLATILFKYTIFIYHFLLQTTILGRQVHRAIRSGLHPAEARLQPRSHHHTQVVAERDPGPSRQTALTCTTAPRRHRAAQVILNLTPRAYDSNYNGRYHGTDIILNHWFWTRTWFDYWCNVTLT